MGYADCVVCGLSHSLVLNSIICSHLVLDRSTERWRTRRSAQNTADITGILFIYRCEVTVLIFLLLFTFIFMHLADAKSDLQCIQDIHCFISMCVPWELNPRPFALLTQCSTTEPQEHIPYSKLFLSVLISDSSWVEVMLPHKSLWSGRSFKEIDSFIHQGCIESIKSDSKDNFCFK